MKTVNEMLARNKWVVESRGFDTPCWVWKQGKTTAGYGETWDGKHVRYTHRVAWEAVHGQLAEGMTIHHRCEQRDCLNPVHMEALTRREHNGKAGHGKLMPEDVAAIRKAFERGETNKALAAEYGVSPSMISFIRTGRRWKD